MKKAPSGNTQKAKPPAKEPHERHVERAHKDAAKPAGPAGAKFNYPIRMG